MEHVKLLGPPDYGPLKGMRAVVLHTTEGGRGAEGARATAVWQASTGNTSGGSYHEIVGHDPGEVTVVRTVRDGRIAGGISTRRDSIWIADTDAELAQLMGADAVADPNAFVYQISIAGTVKFYVANGWPNRLVRALARRIRRVETHYGVKDIFVTGHYRFQSNRSDPSKILIPKIIAAYNDIYSPEQTAPPPPVEADPDQAEIDKLQAQLADASHDLRLARDRRDAWKSLAERAKALGLEISQLTTEG